MSNAALERVRPRRPMLKPALRRLWRDGASLQLGVEARHAVVLCGLSPDEVRFLDLLDGSRDTCALLAHAADVGVDAAGAQRLLDSLGEAGVLDDAATDPAMHERARQRLLPDQLSLSLLHRGVGAAADTLARRQLSTVDVHGAGRVGAAVAALLAAAGIGRLGCIDAGAQRAADLTPAGAPLDPTLSRGAALAQHLPATAPCSSADTEPHDLPALAVIAPVTSVAAPELLAAVRRQPHLLVLVRETTAAIGPFVLPGHTPCVRCVELARGDRDPQWPTLTAQLVGAARAVEACDIVLATLAAAVAASHALMWIDSGRLPPSAAGIVEVDLADGRMRRRSLGAHPACGCGAAG